MTRYHLTISKVNHEEDYLIVTFKKPKDLTFEDGQYGVFLHVNKDFEGRKMRAFSFASSHKERVLTIATKHTKSPFKNELALLKAGDEMTVDGPMGRFGHEPRKDSVFIAGGIGITPIRSILRGLDTYDRSILIYSESREVYPFQDDFEAMEGLTLQLASGRSRTQFLIDHAARLHRNDAVYYVVGGPEFVAGVTDQLSQLGITTTNIRYDRFTGY